VGVKVGVRSRLASVAVLVVAVGAVACVPPKAPPPPRWPGYAQGPVPLQGAGTTFSDSYMDQMRADLAGRGVSLAWQGIDSAAAKQRYASSEIDFAETDFPFEPGEPTGPPSVYSPSTVTGIGFMYNLVIGGERVTSLRLSPEVAAYIYTCQITYWDNPAIAADNPTLSLPHLPIKPVARGDKAITTLRVTESLATRVPNHYTGPVTPTFPVASYPCVTSPALSDGVAEYVRTYIGQGAIGYVENSYAIERGMPLAALRNFAGQFALPTAPAVRSDLTGATRRPDGTYDLSGAYTNPSDGVYPLPSVNYFIVPTTGPTGITATVARVLGLHACRVQDEATPPGYPPLTLAMASDTLNRFSDLPGSGAPPNPTLDDCPNLA
jgi:phosphate transport system substrate-binding protein